MSAQWTQQRQQQQQNFAAAATAVETKFICKFQIKQRSQQVNRGSLPSPFTPLLLHLLPSELKAPWKVKQIQTDTNKQTKLTETAKQTEIKLLLLLSSAPLLLLHIFLLLLLLRFCLLIYFHSHLLQRQQNISSCKVSGEINSASGATHTTCSRDLDPCATPDPCTLSSNFFLIFNEIWLC